MRWTLVHSLRSTRLLASPSSMFSSIDSGVFSPPDRITRPKAAFSTRRGLRRALESLCGQLEMRVIAGRYKGRRLYSVKGRRIRPATDRVKETIFNILSTRLNLTGTTVLDLFAGTGSLGIEALSRGARRTVFVENANFAVQIIERNLRALDAQAYATVVRTDALKYIRDTKEQFDLVFADPPYSYELTGKLPSLIFEHGLVPTGGYLLIEHQDTLGFPASKAYKMSLSKAFGNSVVSFFRSATPNS